MASKNDPRVGVLMHEVLRMMFHVNTCWKKDCILYLNSFTHNPSSSSVTYRNLIKGGYLAEYEPVYPKVHSKSLYGLQNKSSDEVRNAISEKLAEFQEELKKEPETREGSKSRYAVTAITRKGINYLAEKEADTAYFRNSKVYSARFNTEVKDTFVRQLMVSRAMTLMASAGAAVFPNEKPSLYRLYAFLNNDIDQVFNEQTDAEKYSNYMKSDREECIDLMNERGAFYTRQEFGDFLKSIGAMNTETFKSSRAFGVYLSNFTAFLLYEEVPTGQTEIGVRHEVEKRIRNAVNSHFQNALKYHCRVPYTDDKYTDLYTVIISDGESTVYSIASGVKYGRIKLTDEQKNDPEKRGAKYSSIARIREKSKVIGANSEKYSRVFVTPANDAGVLSMNYLCHHSVEDYFRDSAELIKLRPDLFIPSRTMQEPFVFGWEKNSEKRISDVVFMPVYEINLLRRLSLWNADEEDLDGLAIICQPEMADTISHTLTRAATFYDQKTLGKIYIDNEKKHPVAISASDMELIRDLVTANRIFGNGEVYTREQLQELRDKPALKNNLSLVVSKFSVTSSNAKTIPSEIKKYSRSGVALDGRDKFRNLRNHSNTPKKRYRHKPMKRLELVLDETEKKVFKELAKSLDLSVNQTILTLALPLAREMKAEIEKGDPDGKVAMMLISQN